MPETLQQPEHDQHQPTSGRAYQFSLRKLFIWVTAIAAACFLFTQAVGNALLVALLLTLFFVLVPLLVTDVVIRTAKLSVYLLDLLTDPETLRSLWPFKRFRHETASSS